MLRKSKKLCVDCGINEAKNHRCYECQQAHKIETKIKRIRRDERMDEKSFVETLSALFKVLDGKVKEETMIEIVKLVTNDSGVTKKTTTKANYNNSKKVVAVIPEYDGKLQLDFQTEKNEKKFSRKLKRAKLRMTHWSREDDLKVLAYYQDPAKRFEDGTMKKAELARFARSLGRSVGSVEQRSWALRNGKVR